MSRAGCACRDKVGSRGYRERDSTAEWISSVDISVCSLTALAHPGGDSCEASCGRRDEMSWLIVWSPGCALPLLPEAAPKGDNHKEHASR